MESFFRYISYVDYFESGLRLRNAGFLRWKAQQDKHKIEIQIKDIPGVRGVYPIIEEQSRNRIASILMDKGNGSFTGKYTGFVRNGQMIIVMEKQEINLHTVRAFRIELGGDRILRIPLELPVGEVEEEPYIELEAAASENVLIDGIEEKYEPPILLPKKQQSRQENGTGMGLEPEKEYQEEVLGDYRKKAEEEILTGYRKKAGEEILTGYRKKAGEEILTGYREKAEEEILTGYREQAGEEGLTGDRERTGEEGLADYSREAEEKILIEFRKKLEKEKLEENRKQTEEKILEHKERTDQKELEDYRKRTESDGRAEKRVQEVFEGRREGNDRTIKPAAPLLENKWQQLCAQYPVVHPFSSGRPFLSIKPTDFIILRQGYHKLVHNSFLLHGYYNYKHMILGKLYEQEESPYYIGVPGVYYERERQAAQMFGFVGFEGTENPVQNGSYGYYMIEVEI